MKNRPLVILGQHQYATVIAARAEAFDFWRCVHVAIKTALIGCGIVHQLCAAWHR